jgi:hypothetical protein
VVRHGISVEEAARRTYCSPEQVRKQLGKYRKLMEGEARMEHRTELGTTGLSYGTPAAEEMIRCRIKMLEGRGYPDARSAAIGQLADEGNLRVLREVTTQDRYLGEPAQREIKAEQRQQPQREQDDLDTAKREAKRRGISLSELINERAMRGEVAL